MVSEQDIWIDLDRWGREVVWIRLSYADASWALDVGSRRHFKSVGRGDRDNMRAPAETSLPNHILGANGEVALSRIEGVPWRGGIDEGPRGDIGSVHVRTSTDHDMALIHRPKDNKDAPFALMTGDPGTRIFCARGWIMGYDARKPRYAEGKPPPAWFVWQKDLLVISSLPHEFLAEKEQQVGVATQASSYN